MKSLFRVYNTISLVFFLFFSLSNTFIFSASKGVTAHDPYDPTGNITIKWDVMNWTPDGYVAVVSIVNSQLYRTVQPPGWKLGWTWWPRREEIIWSVIGGQAIDQGNCSMFIGNIPHSCSKRPVIVDLPTDTPPNQRITNCCRGGRLSSRYQAINKSTASFQISVGNAGTNNRTVRMPKNFTFVGGRAEYICGPAKMVRSTRFITPDERRTTQAMMTWKVVCTYKRANMANKFPSCCVSLSSFDQRKKANCPTCSCGCRHETCNTRSQGNPGIVPPLMKCTDHMCPVNINWQMLQPKEKGAYMTVNVSISNFNYRINYTDWALLVNHPFINKLTRVVHANHKQFPNFKMAELMWGIKHKNAIITTSGRKGSTVSWVMQLYKDKSTNTTSTSSSCKKDWCAPNEIFFNGDRCVIASL
ncbi:hypothetical protein MKX01_033287 [Papaver californicum]|nr:hypothetical protein MKX01_033287 [Papaver californicum]